MVYNSRISIHIWRVIRVVFSLAVCFFFAVTGESNARTVFVVSDRGEQGHGWLFGDFDKAANKIKCWIALPAHVVRSRATGGLVPFEIAMQDKGRAFADQAIGVVQVPEALAVLNGNDDLAFAKLNLRPSSCLSRLGPDRFVYDLLVRRQVEAKALNMVSTSFGFVNGQVERSGIGARSVLVRFKVSGGDNELARLQGGLSGSTFEAISNGQQIPFAMVLEVDPGSSSVTALRFDAIKQAFALVKFSVAPIPQLTQDAQTDDRFDIVEYSAITIDGGGGPFNLNMPDKCWRFGPEGGKSTASLTLELSKSDTDFRQIKIALCAPTSDDIEIGIDAKGSNSRFWTRMGDCILKEGQTEVICPTQRIRTNEVKVSFRARALALNTLELAALY